MGKYQLRALAVSEILDAALRIYRTKFAVLLGIASAAMIPESLLEVLLINTFPEGGAQRLQNSLTSIFSGFATMALIVAISSAYLGEEFTIGSTYSKGLRRFWSIAGANFLVGLIVVIPILVFAVCLVAAMPNGYLLMFVFVIFLMPVIVYLSTRWSLSSQAIILEDIGAVDGLKRTWNLTKDHFWRVFGTSFAASLLSIMLNLLPFLFVDYILSFSGLEYRIIQLIELVVQQVSIIIGLPFTVAVTVLIYYDLRIRKEGFDLLMRSEEIQLPL